MAAGFAVVVVVAIVVVFHSNIGIVNPNHASSSKNHLVDRVVQ